MLHLLVRFEGAEEKFSFEQDVVTLGRVSSNSIQVKDVKASRNHCELRKNADGSWKLVDLESSNGTSLNGTKVNTASLKPGDVVAIGKFEIVFDPQAATAAPAVKKSKEPIEKTVVDTTPIPKGATPEATAMAATGVGSRNKSLALATKGAIAAAVLIGIVVVINKVSGASAERKAQESRYLAAVKTAENGDLEDAVAKLEAFLVSNPEADLLKRASSKRDELKGQIAMKAEQERLRRDAGINELLAKQAAATAASRYEKSVAQVDAYVGTGDYAAAVDEAKRFMMEFGEGEHHDRMAKVLRGALAKASEAWESIEDRANGLTKAGKYAEATALLREAEPRFSGTRFSYDMLAKIAAIHRLAGITTAYAAVTSEMSAAAQESLLAIDDYVRARKYPEALKAMVKLLETLPQKDREALAGRKTDIRRQAGIFERMVAAINAGAYKDYPIDLGGGINGWLSQASDLGVTIEFKDASGKGGTTGRKWIQVPSREMLVYFRHLEMNEQERLGLASFCYDNRMPLDAADILQDLAAKQGSMQPEVFALIARVRQMGVPADGFVYLERGWYTKSEYMYAKLDIKAKKGAQAIGKIDEKAALEGHAVYAEMMSDASLEAAFKEKVKGYFVEALKAKRRGIIKGLENSQNIANYRALQEMKRELNRRRAEAIRVIYDKTIYPDENHGVEGQPEVDDKVKLVREMWDKPLKVAARLDEGVRVLVEAGTQTNDWLVEMGESTDDAEYEEYELMLAHVNEALNLKNVCLDKNEQAVRDYNRRVWAFNKDGADTQMVGVELECAKITNEYREMQGRCILEIHKALGIAAKKHSQEMVDLSYFAHESPTPELRTPGDRVKKEGYVGPCGENICTGYGDARAAFNAWYNSSGHHRNMLSDMWNHIGLGCVGGSMWTENLGKAAYQVEGPKAGGSKRGGTRGGVGEPKKAPAGGDGASEKKEDKGAAAPAGGSGGEGKAKAESPYKKPDGKCTGTTPYDESGGGSPPAEEKK